jgi:hypothetical protein
VISVMPGVMCSRSRFRWRPRSSRDPWNT